MRLVADEQVEGNGKGDAKTDRVGKKKMVIRDDKPGILGETERPKNETTLSFRTTSTETPPLLCRRRRK
jgi:hypothetical protein